MDMLCVQETRWKGSKVRSTKGRFKLFYYGGAGAILKEMYMTVLWG